MSKKDQSPLSLNSKNRDSNMTDRELSERYHRSMRSIETRTSSDQAVLALATAKADSMARENQASKTPFFGSERFRSWTSATAFGVVGICLWVVLQAPQESLAPEPATAVWQDSVGADDNESDTSDVEARVLKIKVESVSAESLSSSDPQGSEYTRESSPAADQERLKTQFRRAQTQAAVQKAVQKPIAKPAVDFTAPLRSVEGAVADPLSAPELKSRGLEVGLTAPRSLNRAAKIKRESMAADEVMETDINRSSIDRRQVFEEQLKLVRELIKAQRWQESVVVYEQLLEQYAEFEIPALIAEQLESHRLNRPMEMIESKP
jgi:hypothetical protein